MIDRTSFQPDNLIPHSGTQRTWTLEDEYVADVTTTAREIADFDHLGALEPFALQLDLVHAQRRNDLGDQRRPGGATDRPPLPLGLLEAIVAEVGKRGRRWRLKGDEKTARLESLELASRLEWIDKHKGRGLTPHDYALQREWTQARSVNMGWWQRPDAPLVLPTVCEPLARLLGNNQTRIKLCAMLAQATRCGYLGITASAPKWAAVIGCALSTFWDAIAWLESRGVLVRMRRWKPGKKGKGGAPVAYADNWYGAGPALLAVRELWGQREIGERDDEVFKVRRREEAKALARHRRRRHRVEVRRGRSRPPVIAVPSREEWIASTLDGADAAYAAAERAAAAEAAREDLDKARVRALLDGDFATFQAANDAYQETPPTPPPAVLEAQAERWQRVADAIEGLPIAAVIGAARAADRAARRGPTPWSSGPEERALLVAFADAFESLFAVAPADEVPADEGEDEHEGGELHSADPTSVVAEGLEDLLAGEAGAEELRGEILVSESVGLAELVGGEAGGEELRGDLGRELATPDLEVSLVRGEDLGGALPRGDGQGGVEVVEDRPRLPHGDQVESGQGASEGRHREPVAAPRRSIPHPPKKFDGPPDRSDPEREPSPEGGTNERHSAKSPLGPPKRRNQFPSGRRMVDPKGRDSSEEDPAGRGGEPADRPPGATKQRAAEEVDRALNALSTRNPTLARKIRGKLR